MNQGNTGTSAGSAPSAAPESAPLESYPNPAEYVGLGAAHNARGTGRPSAGASVPLTSEAAAAACFPTAGYYLDAALPTHFVDHGACASSGVPVPAVHEFAGFALRSVLALGVAVGSMRARGGSGVLQCLRWLRNR
ncbi:hypothetical protein FVE85_4477 [Porphyridium purpureum]|uniref:Uncharacterized protein n=1 Tax=Porphyridium purpureum TaxID=35688 RepID=A0A5J4YJN1_PORPP|nr:hypothetical protein FVE85_4477 [Porphyridium purpureum]|eukprot:POR0166..scf297_16